MSIDTNADFTSLAFSPDSRLAAIGRADGVISIVDVEAMQVIAELDAHNSSVDHLAFSQDGVYLASAREDGMIKFGAVEE